MHTIENLGKWKLLEAKSISVMQESPAMTLQASESPFDGMETNQVAKV